MMVVLVHVILGWWVAGLEPGYWINMFFQVRSGHWSKLLTRFYVQLVQLSCRFTLEEVCNLLSQLTVS